MRKLQRATDPLFRQAGMNLDGEGRSAMSDETQFGLLLQAIGEMSGAVDRMRGEIMARLDRHGDELSAIHEDIIVNFGAPPITSSGATSTRTKSCSCSAIRSTGVAQHDLAHWPVAYALWSLNKLIGPLPLQEAAQF